MALIEFICLANSRKHEGRCVAGVRTDGLGWVRPVSPLDGTLWPVHYTLADGTAARPLDVLQADLAGPYPQPHQPENWLLGDGPWQLVRRPAGPEAIPLLRDQLVHGAPLFGTEGDRVPYAAIQSAPAPRSLALVYARDLRWSIGTGARGNRQTRAVFSVPGLSGVTYRLSVTDPLWEARLAHLAEGEHPREAGGLLPEDRVMLTVSLGEPFEGHCYKLVATVILVPRWTTAPPVAARESMRVLHSEPEEEQPDAAARPGESGAREA